MQRLPTGAACAKTCAPVTIALHRCRLDAGDSARDVLPHPRHAPSETGAPFGGVPFRPVVFPDFAGATLERRASIMPALSNNAPHYGARFLKVKRTGRAGWSMRRICARPLVGGRLPLRPLAMRCMRFRRAHVRVVKGLSAAIRIVYSDCETSCLTCEGKRVLQSSACAQVRALNAARLARRRSVSGASTRGHRAD